MSIRPDYWRVVRVPLGENHQQIAAFDGIDCGAEHLFTCGSRGWTKPARDGRAGAEKILR